MRAMRRVGKWVEIRAFVAWGSIAAATMVGGCSSDQIYEYRAHTDKVTSGAGNAMASNRAVHTIDPWPYESQNTQIDMDGKRAQVAIRRYETDKNGNGSNGNGSNGNGSNGNGAPKF